MNKKSYDSPEESLSKSKRKTLGSKLLAGSTIVHPTFGVGTILVMEGIHITADFGGSSRSTTAADVKLQVKGKKLKKGVDEQEKDTIK